MANGRSAVGLLGWVPGNIVVLALPLWHSLNAAATLRVGLILIMPMLQVIAALTILLVPALVRARLSGKLRSVSTTAMIIFVGFGVAYGPVSDRIRRSTRQIGFLRTSINLID